MVESQAIGRVLRLGQERNVRVVRYIMKGTVEEVRTISTLADVQLTDNRRLRCKVSKSGRSNTQKSDGTKEIVKKTAICK
jgi:hypothetical protein